MVNKKYTVISSFAGGGGLILGYKWAGFTDLLAIEFDDNAVETLRLNYPDLNIYHGDITKLSGKECLKLAGIKKGDLDIFDGSPPCQGFSTAGKRQINDGRNNLFKEYTRLIKELQPKVFIMENVSGMIKGKMKGKYLGIWETLNSLNYVVKSKLINSMWYEVPQSRERLFFIGVRNDLQKEPVFPEPLKTYITFEEATKNIENNEMPPPLSKCFQQYVPKMKQGNCVADFLPGKHFQTQRIFADRVCPTITKIIAGIGFGALIHPFENRVLFIGELKRVCSFPDDYTLIGKYQEQKVRLGNAVMPKMMYHIAKTIKEQILN